MAFLGAIGSALGSVGSAIGSAAGSAGSAIGSAASSVGSGIGGAAQGIGSGIMGAAKGMGGNLMQAGQQTMGGLGQMGQGIGNLFSGNSPAGMQANPQTASLQMNQSPGAGKLGFEFNTEFVDPDTAWHQIYDGMSQARKGIGEIRDELPQGQQQQPLPMMPPQYMQQRAPAGPMAQNQGLAGLSQLANSFQRR